MEGYRWKRWEFARLGIVRDEDGCARSGLYIYGVPLAILSAYYSWYWRNIGAKHAHEC